MPSDSEVFQPVINLPEPIRAARYARLVGLDDVKARLRKEASVLADTHVLTTWANHHHPEAGPDNQAIRLLTDRAPLVIFGGDVGSGKSALAESFGCDLAERLHVPVQLWRLKLTARGTGHVGEMTTLIGEAFGAVGAEARLGRGTDGRLKAVTILVVDEADALVQSRESAQMHHEDRAGVDAFLAGVDAFAGTGLPLIVVLCTNRLTALDPAIRRRAAATFEFGRPDDAQRRRVLTDAFGAFGISDDIIDKVVLTTGPQAGGAPGFTYSDLTQRLVPSVILEAVPDSPITGDLVLSVAQAMQPTPPFIDRAAS